MSRMEWMLYQEAVSYAEYSAKQLAATPYPDDSE